MDAKRAWDSNAQFWDERMGEGNEFFRVLVWPAIERLLPVVAGTRVLEIACGNGVAARRLASGGARVLGIDFSEALIDLAKRRTQDAAVDYRVVDATDYDSLIALGEGMFEAALCNMAMMDIADLRPLLRALGTLLGPGMPFVFSILHPCFNNPATVHVGELEDRFGNLDTTYAVKISRYMTPYTRHGTAMRGQPVPHPYFHRSLESLLAPGFEAGFVVDAIEERAFPPDHSGGATALSWNGRFSEIPPVLVVRMRRAADNPQADDHFSRSAPSVGRR